MFESSAQCEDRCFHALPSLDGGVDTKFTQNGALYEVRWSIEISRREHRKAEYSQIVSRSLSNQLALGVKILKLSLM